MNLDEASPQGCLALNCHTTGKILQMELEINW